MGTVLGFAVGYIIGAHAGSEGFDELVEALRTVRDSEEFHALVAVARNHVRGTAATVGAWLATLQPATAEQMVARARERARSQAAGRPARQEGPDGPEGPDGQGTPTPAP